MDQPDMFLTNGVWGVQKDEIFVPGQKCVHTICLKNNSFKLRCINFIHCIIININIVIMHNRSLYKIYNIL